MKTATSLTPDLGYCSVGYILLSRDCEIIELSDDIKSCPGTSVDRTLLFEAMSASDASLLREMCLGSPECQESMLIKLRISDYRYAYATRVKSKGRGVALLLVKGYRDLIHLGEASVNYLPELTADLPRSFPELFSSSGILTCTDAVTLLSSIASRFSKGGDVISSMIVFSRQDHAESESETSGAIPSGPLSLAFTTLLTILDSASSDGTVVINASSFSGSLEVEMSTRFAVSDNTFGEVSDIVLLAKQLKGAFLRLSLAAFVASEGGMHLTSAISPSGEVSFYLSHISEAFPPLEFKFDDPEGRSELLISDTLRLLSRFDFTFE